MKLLFTALLLPARFAARVRGFRSDQRGSLTLLAGMMVFMATIFSIIAFDTNMAVYNRVMTQNAVDSAADSAALWQARACNMLQQLNNLHYDVDKALAIAEGVAATACVVSGGLLIAELAAEASIIAAAAAPAIRATRMGVCLVCETLPFIDKAQDLFYQAIMPVQQGIVTVAPFLAFGYANACAKGSGADPLLAAVGDFTGGLLSSLGINIPGGSSIGGAIGSGLGSIPIYAAPLDPTALQLFVKRRDNDGSPPLKWPEEIGEVGDTAGQLSCADAIPTYSSAKNASQFGDGPWGWDDQYFFGHPGFMTWIAGKTNRTELLGLDNPKWLNADTNDKKSEDEVTRVLYNGQTVGGTPIKIPAFVAVASSQIEGNPVVMHKDPDAQGKLIKVFLPSNTSKSLDSLWIFH